MATYVYGGGIDEVLTMRRELPDGQGGTAPEDLFYHSDDQGTVWALTDNVGSVLERYDYEDYGRSYVLSPAGAPLPPGALGEAESAVANPYRYTGRRFDPESGLYWYRTRYYDPRAGRFSSRDTIGIWGDPANLGNGYAYVGNNPWTFVDPFGESKKRTRRPDYPREQGVGESNEAYDRYYKNIVKQWKKWNQRTGQNLPIPPPRHRPQGGGGGISRLMDIVAAIIAGGAMTGQTGVSTIPSIAGRMAGPAAILADPNLRDWIERMLGDSLPPPPYNEDGSQKTGDTSEPDPESELDDDEDETSATDPSNSSSEDAQPSHTDSQKDSEGS